MRKKNPVINPPFSYFGGKRRAAAEVWAALGDVDRYVEPFFGSGAVLLRNPHPLLPASELVNDLDHHVVNVWRSLQVDPAEVVRVTRAPISEAEQKARAAFLRDWEPPDLSDLRACDPYVAGLWIWAACVTIGHRHGGLRRGGFPGGVKGKTWTIETWADLVARLEGDEVLCGDWSRCVTRSGLGYGKGPVGVFLDPPYGTGDCVYDDNTGDIARDVWAWATANGEDPRLRIVVAGYDDGRDVPEGWRTVSRKEHGGLTHATRKGGLENDNRKRERLWLSPHCFRGDDEPTNP